MNIQTRLAEALERARRSARREVLKSVWLRRSDRELLLARGYLQEICKGWHFLIRPMQQAGESTAWYAAFWNFLAVYLGERFGNDYCLSAGPSLDVHTGANVIPRQVTAITAHGGKTGLDLLHHTSLLVYQDAKNLPREVAVVDDLRVMPLPLALCRMPATFFRDHAADAEIALRAVKHVEDLTRVILEMNSPGLAARLVGACEHLGDAERARQIRRAAEAAGLSIEPQNPFAQAAALSGATRLVSPYAGRIEAMFREMRQPVLDAFHGVRAPKAGPPEVYLRHVDEVYEQDAYNSLSIEGYRVTPALIEKIRLGQWHPEENPQDRDQVNAMTAKGYLAAFQAVKKSVRRVLQGSPAAAVVKQDYQDWYRALFGESVKAGLLEAHHLAGHRNDRVFIRASRHVPPPSNAVNDAMDALFDALQAEREAIVRAVLGHFLFGFIHPYMDGNGRMARFFMNVMMASGGYPWTIVRTARRKQYLEALETASVEKKIVHFAEFIRQEMGVKWRKEFTRPASTAVRRLGNSVR